jgi:hypothetical protein
MRTNKENQSKCSVFLESLVGSRYEPFKLKSLLEVEFNLKKSLEISSSQCDKLPEQDDCLVFTLDSEDIFADVTLWYLKTNSKALYIIEVGVNYE